MSIMTSKNNHSYIIIIVITLILILASLTIEFKLIYDYYKDSSKEIKNNPVIDQQGFQKILEKIK